MNDDFPVFGSFESYFKSIFYIGIISIGAVVLFVILLVMMLFYLGILAF